MKVLLVSHEASRTGAPRIAISVAKALIGRGYDVEILSRAPGPLLSEFQNLAPTSVEFLGRVRRRLWRSASFRYLAWVVDYTLALLTVIRRRPDAVYVNSSSAAIYILAARCLRRKTILHVHESGELIARFLAAARVQPDLRNVFLIACSPSVHRDLCELCGRSGDGVSMVASVPDAADVLRRSAERPANIYSDCELVVGCCGSVEHRKGADLWLDVASKVNAALPNRRIRFVWVGEVIQPLAPGPWHGNVTFLGPSVNPYAHMRRFDVATLPSRDDPFPLVVLEAMLVGTPVVAFGVGSVATQIGDAGIVVPPGDTEAFAREVIRLLSDAAERKRLGDAGHARVAALFSTQVFTDSLAAVLETIVGPAGSDPRAVQSVTAT